MPTPKMFWPENFYHHIQSAIERRTTAILSSGVYDSSSDTVKSLERTLSAVFGFKHAVCVASGSDALKIAAHSYILTDSEPLDMVAVPAYSHPCVFEAARHTRCVSTKSLPRIAVLDQNPVDYTLIHPLTPVIDPPPPSLMFIMSQPFGSVPQAFPADLSYITRPSLIIDAATSTGSPEGFCPNGPEPAAVCLSFNPSSPLGTLGNGGAILTNNACLALTASSVRNHGFVEQFGIPGEFTGMNSHMSAFEAAFVLERIDSLEYDNNLRVEYFNRLLRATSSCRALCRPVDTGIGTPWVFSVILDPSISREDLITNLEKREIAYRVYYPDLCCTLNRYESDLPEARSLSNRIISFSIDPYQPVSQFIAAEKFLAQCITASSRFSEN